MNPPPIWCGGPTRPVAGIHDHGTRNPLPEGTDASSPSSLQVRGCEYGTLEYVLRLELRKQSRANLRISWFATLSCTLGVWCYWAAAFSFRPGAEGFKEVRLGATW